MSAAIESYLYMTDEEIRSERDAVMQKIHGTRAIKKIRPLTQNEHKSHTQNVNRWENLQKAALARIEAKALLFKCSRRKISFSPKKR